MGIVTNGEYGWQKLIAGDWWLAIAQANTAVVGELFWAFATFMPIFLIYVKNETLLTPAVTTILISGVAMMVLPVGVTYIMALIVILGIATTLYKAYV